MVEQGETPHKLTEQLESKSLLGSARRGGSQQRHQLCHSQLLYTTNKQPTASGRQQTQQPKTAWKKANIGAFWERHPSLSIPLGPSHEQGAGLGSSPCLQDHVQEVPRAPLMSPTTPKGTNQGSSLSEQHDAARISQIISTHLG